MTSTPPLPTPPPPSGTALGTIQPSSIPPQPLSVTPPPTPLPFCVTGRPMATPPLCYGGGPSPPPTALRRAPANRFTRRHIDAPPPPQAHCTYGGPGRRGGGRTGACALRRPSAWEAPVVEGQLLCRRYARQCPVPVLCGCRCIPVGRCGGGEGGGGGGHTCRTPAHQWYVFHARVSGKTQ